MMLTDEDALELLLPEPFTAVWAGSDAETCRLDVCYTPSAPRYPDGTYATKLYTAEQMLEFAKQYHITMVINSVE